LFFSLKDLERMARIFAKKYHGGAGFFFFPQKAKLLFLCGFCRRSRGGRLIERIKAKVNKEFIFFHSLYPFAFILYPLE
jgi:hypothetical protein